jgi:glycosyltransferase involved in cell wall biosynthesis
VEPRGQAGAAVSRLARLAGSAPARRALRSGPARRLAPWLAAAQREPEDPVRDYAAWAALERDGPVPLAPASAPADSLDVAFVVPGFRRGSGGHVSIAGLVRGLERRGHRCAVWIDDPGGRSGGAAAFRTFFGPFAATAIHGDLGGWRGAGVAVATGWQTVATVLRLPGCAARAQLVQDDEARFYPDSAERLWAQRAHGHGLPAITAGTWLAGLTAAVGSFEFGVDAAVYRPQPHVRRRPRQVLFYARPATPRRAVPLGMLALAELHARRPDTEIALYGDSAPLTAPFPFTALGVLEPAQAARAYAEATVGLVLSLTNYSLVAPEMLACGLPPVELRGPSTEAAFAGAPVELAEPTPSALAGALERLLADPDERARRAAAGAAWTAPRTWDAAAAAVEAGLRAARDR